MNIFLNYGGTEFRENTCRWTNIMKCDRKHFFLINFLKIKREIKFLYKECNVLHLFWNSCLFTTISGIGFYLQLEEPLPHSPVFIVKEAEESTNSVLKLLIANPKLLNCGPKCNHSVPATILSGDILKRKHRRENFS